MANDDVINGAASGAATGSAAGGYGALIGGAIGAVGGLLGSSSKKKAAKAAEAAAARNLALWSGIKIPTIEEQKIILQTPDLVGQYSPEQVQFMEQQQSSMEQAGADPATIQAQNDTLNQLQEISKGGLTEADKAAARGINNEVNQQSQARQKAILNAMASRGTLGSGMELAAQLQGNQQSTQQASNAGDELIKQAQARSLQALGQQGQLAGQMRGQQFGEQSDKARARDEINRFNTVNRQNIVNANIGERNKAQQMNLESMQNRENTRANLANIAEKSNKDLYQSQFNNQIAKTQGLTGAGSAAGQAIANSANSAAQQQQNLFGSIVGGALQGYKYPTNTVKAATGGLITNDGLLTNPETIDQFKLDTAIPSTQPEPVNTPPPVPLENTLDPRYKAAMDQSRETQAQSNLLNTFLSAMEGTGTGYKANRAPVEALNQYAKQPLEDYNQLKTQEKEKSAAKKAGLENEKDLLDINKMKRMATLEESLDQPGTSVSQNLASSILTKTKKLGMNLDPEQLNKMSANQLKLAFPWAQEDYKLAVEGEEKKAERASREKISAEDNASKKELQKTMAEEKATAKDEKIVGDYEKRMKDDLDPDKARAGNLAKNQAQVYQADRLKQLYTESNGDVRNLDSRQMEELAIGLQKLLSSGQSSVTQVQALVPHTIRGNAAKLKEWLVNDPQGTNQIAFVQRMAETIERERNLAQDQVKSAQKKRLSAYSEFKKKNPERYDMILRAYGLDDASNPSKETVNMMGPDGKTRRIPKDQVEAATKAGGQVVQ